MFLEILKKWGLAIRPKTLWVTICPIAIGSVLANTDQSFHLLSASSALLSGLFIQIGTNLANDYFDFKKGADTKERLGPVRMSQSGQINPNHIKLSFILCFTLAAIFGAYLIFRGGLPIIIIGITAILSGILYTATPFALGYNGLADIFVFAYFGPIAVAGTYYVQALSYSNDAAILGCGTGLLSIAILAVNNTRDIETDRKANKKTLCVRFGKSFGITEYILSWVLALIIPLYFILRDNSHYGLISVLACLPLFIILTRHLISKSGKDLNPLLGKTSFGLLLYSILIILGW